jgi:triacylglycerol lipase
MPEFLTSRPVLAGLLALGVVAAVVAWVLLRRRPWRGARTRYPVVLAHGMFGFAEIGIGGVKQNYFKGIPEHLQELGVKIYRARVPPASSVAKRAAVLADAIRDVPERKVNIIAHSMGGLDARYAISKLHVARRVASLTTIGTPHRGTPVADAGTYMLGEKLGIRRILSSVGLGLDAFYNLTTDHMAVFNREVPDARGVRYYSVVARVGKQDNAVHSLLSASHDFLDQHAGPNDGLVPVESQRWGKVLFEIEAGHWAQIGWSSGLDAPAFYEKLLSKLRSQGL